MPHASPRYSPVGSKLSVKPNEASQPTVSVPPVPAAFFDGLDLAAKLAVTAITAPRATTSPATTNLRNGLFTLDVSLLPPRHHGERGLQLTAPFDDTGGQRLVASCGSAVRPHVESVPEAVTEQVEGQSRDDEEQAREEHQPPGHVVVDGRPIQQAAPRGGLLRDAEAEVRERRLEDDRLRDQQRRVDEQRADQIRQHLAEDDPYVARAQR